MADAERACVIGAPRGFDLVESVRTASSVDIVTAFAHATGWRLIRSALLEKSRPIRVITGFSFFQTEPKLLAEWLGQKCAAAGIRPYVWTGDATFHPKVFIIKGRRTFALIGSGNLSRGGLSTNVECFQYISGKAEVELVAKWLEALMRSKLIAELTGPLLKTYQAKWTKAQRSKRALDRLQTEADLELRDLAEAQFANWNSVVRAAQSFFRKNRGAAWLDHKAAAKRITALLDLPTANFSRESWDEFYSIEELGHLIPIWKDRVFRQRTRLRAGIRLLCDESRPVEARIDAVCTSGPHRVNGLGINAVSKILACIAPNRWPVENHPVHVACRSFGYRGPRGASMGERYAAFAKLMSRLKEAAGARDMLELDAFFYSHWVQLGRPVTKLRRV